jgi:hypothetical protein
VSPPPVQRGLPRLEDLPQGPVAGPTAMTRAHLNGMRKTVSRIKAWLKPEQSPQAATKALLLTYLGEWEKVYGEGVDVLGLSQTERTIMVIRRDTVQQMLNELAR